MPSVKEIYKKIDDVRIEADSVNLNVDGLEALASTQQADIALIKADVDDIRADLANGVTINQPVAITDNGGSVTVDGTVTVSSLPEVILGSTPVYDSGDDSININIKNIGTGAAGVDSSLPISGTVTALPQTGNVTEASTKTITTGGTDQQVFAANASRKFLLVQNVSDTDMNLGIGYNPTASTGIFLGKNGSGIVFESGFIPTQEIRILCATTGKAFVALEG
jgi:hypothetical protein